MTLTNVIVFYPGTICEYITGMNQLYLKIGFLIDYF